jgi:hypothetical protein
MRLEIGHAAGAKLVHEVFHLGKVLFPHRERGILKECAVALLVRAALSGRALHFLRHDVRGHVALAPMYSHLFPAVVDQRTPGARHPFESSIPRHHPVLLFIERLAVE